MSAYYNEIDPFCAQWLRNLITKGLIAPGEVDERSIRDVSADDVRGFRQCHFFAGIGGWSHALKLAGWPDEQPVWTGSCPCQPFSLAGSRKEFEDDRHLWPEFRRIIEKQRPATVFAEQVASASAWLSGVHRDLEGLAYTVGAVPIEAACAGAAHKRDRYWIVAHDDLQFSRKEELQRGREFRRSSRHSEDTSVAESEYIVCGDGKRRRMPPPGVRSLGNGIPARVAKLRAFGNAIYPHVAAEFICSYMDFVERIA